MPLHVGGILIKYVTSALLVVTLTSAAMADGLSDPVIEPDIIEAGTSSSGGDNWVIAIMTLAVFGTALTN